MWRTHVIHLDSCHLKNQTRHCFGYLFVISCQNVFIVTKVWWQNHVPLFIWVRSVT